MRRGKNIRKRSDGRWEARVAMARGPDGKLLYKSLYGHTYREAADKKAAFEKAHAPDWPLPESEGPPRFQELSILWMADAQKDWKETTYAQYSECLRSQIIPCWGKRRLTEITQAEYDAFIGNCSRKLKPNSIKMINSILNGIVKYSVKAGYLDKIPFVTSRPPNGENYSEIEILKKSEVAQISDYCFCQNDPRALGILIALHEGARIGEICSLRWQDIDFQENGIHIRHTLQRIRNPDRSDDASKTILHFGPPKNNRERIIPIHQKLRKLLQNRSRESPDDHFIIRNQKPCEPRTLANYFKRILEILGIRDVCFHTLRHTFASLCIENGVNIKALSEILGHASVKITMDRYVHLTLRFKQEQLGKLQIPYNSSSKGSKKWSEDEESQ